MGTHRIYAAALTVLVLFALTHASGAQEAERKTRTMYVKVASSNPGAVIQSSTDFFEAEPLGTLMQNQAVEMIENVKDGGYVKILARIDGKTVEGWVKAIILQEKPLDNVPRVSESGEVDNASFAAPSRGRDINRSLRSESPQMKAALERIDAFEKFIADSRGIKNEDHERMDMTPYIGRVKAFALEGGLAPGSFK